MSFLSSLFGGSNPTINAQLGQLGTIAGTNATEGASDTSAASTFFHSLLDGNTSQTLAPENSAIQKQNQQAKQTAFEFGNRSGGTNASVQASDDKTRATTNDFTASLLSGAASNLANIGSTATSTSLAAYKSQLDDSQDQLKNWQNSILGQGVSSGIGYLEGFGLGKV